MALVPLSPQVADRTVRDMLARNAAERPAATALIVPGADGGKDLRVSYGELLAAADALAARWRAAGVGRGDRVAILLANDRAYEAHVAYHAAHRLGAINVPLNTFYVARELEHVIGFTAPRVLVCDTAFAPLLAAIALPESIAVLATVGEREGEREGDGEGEGEGNGDGDGDGHRHGGVGERAGEEPTWWRGREQPLVAAIAAGGGVPAIELSEHEDADWLFTSGTTGNPKAVAFTHANAVACAHQSRALWGLHEGSVYQSSAPFFTSTGSHTNLLGCLAAGCSYVVEAEFNAQRTLERISRYGTSSIFVISGALALLLDRVGDEQLQALRGGSLRRLIYGGQSMPASFYARVEERLGERGLGLELVHLYGLTEGGTSGMKLPPALHASAVRDRCGPYGLTVGNEGFNEWVEFRVVDEHDRDAPPGAPGEVLFRGPAVMSRYVDEPEASAEALRGGWLHSGDVGMLDADGFMYFVDRKKQIIRRGGLNISSAEVEGVIVEHPDVVEAAVVAQPNPILEEEIRAVVVRRDGASLDAKQVIEHCRARLAEYKVPVQVDFVDALPRNAMGRVMKNVLTGGGGGLAAVGRSR